jgi:hypothetical protein
VRAFSSLKGQKEGTIEVAIPNGLKKGILILYLQNKAWKVTAAASKIF